MHNRKISLVVLLLILVLSGIMNACIFPTKIERTNKVLIKNRVKLDKTIETASELEGFIQQKPNTKLLGLFRFNLWVHRYASKGNEGRFKRWLNKSVAEKPVFLDTLLTEMGARKMKLYLNNVGYFNSTVTKNYKYKEHKVIATYQVKTGKPYRIRKIDYSFRDSVLGKIVQDNILETKVKSGDIYNAYTLDEERDRLTLLIKNKGYYAFTKDFIRYSVDSAHAEHVMDLVMTVNNPRIEDPSRPGTIMEAKHRLYRIRNVQIIPDYDPLQKQTLQYDTLLYIKNTGSPEADTFLLLSHEKMKVKPAVLIRSLVVEPGDLYSQEMSVRTHDRLGDLQFFQLINVVYKLPEDSEGLDTLTGWLDCVVQLSRNKFSAASIGGEMTNTGGDFGVSMITSYEHRNIFHGAELLSVSLKGAMENRRNYKSDSVLSTGVFNTYEAGIRVSLLLPKFLLPINQDKIKSYFRPKTRINSGFNFEQTPDYTRFVTDGGFGYEWNQSKRQKHILNPVELSMISIEKTDDFQHYLDSINDPWYSEQYTDHFIAGLSYSFIFSNQDLKRKTNFVFFRGNLQTAGNLIAMVNNFIPPRTNDLGKQLIFGIPFSQFVKVNGDFRDYIMLKKTSLVLRAMAGIGIAYGNSEALPFDRGFYAGGANGLRGWLYGALGPGGFSDVSYMQRYDHMGDIQLEANVEYRFPIIGMFHGGLFTDIGNVWLLRQNDQFPQGEFSSDFLSQVAVDAGVGFRLDLSFFVFRLDGALKLRIPSEPAGQRWINPGLVQLKDISWNFGIGYPF